MVGTEATGIVFVAGTASDRDGFKAHCPAQLHPEVSQTANAQHRDPITGYRVRAAQRVVGRHTGTAHRGGVGERQLVWNPRERGGRHHHRFRIAARIMPAWNVQIRAVDKVAFSARSVVAAVTSEPSDRDAITDAEIGNTATNLQDCPGDFMPRVNGQDTLGKSPRTKARSVPQMPHAETARRTSPRPGEAVSTPVTSNGPPADLICTAR